MPRPTSPVPPLLLLSLLVTSARCCNYLPINTILPIAENATIGTILPIVERNGSFLPTETFFIESETPTPFPFQFLSVNISLNLTKSLDRETHPSYTMKLICKRSGSKVASMLVVVQLMDIDDTSPVWDPPGHYSVSLNEGNEVGVLLPFGTNRPRISDGDEFGSQSFRISILPGPFSSYFEVTNPSTTTPDIRVTKILDYEDKSSYNVTLQFEDFDLTGQLMFSGNATLVVNVMDVEDEPPKFGHSKYWTVVRANATKGLVLQLDPDDLHAKDGDTSMNATVNYELYSGNIVDVNATTGVLSLSRDNPNPGSYFVYVKAFEVDKVKRTSMVEVQINITSTSLVPVCENPDMTIQVPEDTKVGSTIDSIKINYPVQSQISIAVQTNAAIFNVIEKRLVLKQALDFESVREYDVTVRVSSSSSTKSSDCLFRIKVTDVNDHTPEFLKSSYTFNSDTQGLGVIIGYVQAVDNDLNSSITYSIISSLRSFAVDPATGAVKINTTAALSEKLYSFLVVASDSGSPVRRGQALVKVNVKQAVGVSSANSLVIAMATLGGLLIFVLVVAGIVFFLYRKRSPKPSPTSDENQNGQAANLYFYETQQGTETAWTNMPSPLEAMYREYCTKEPGTPEGRVSGQGGDDEAPCINLGTEFSTGPGSIRSVVSGRNTAASHPRHRIVPTPVVDSPAELSEVEGSIESYSINHDTPPPPAAQSPQPRLDNMTYFM